MKFREMTVWSGGSETAKNAKLNTFCYFIAFILLCFFHVLTFTCNMHDDKNIPMTLLEHIFCGVFFLVLLGWFTLLMFFAAKDSLENIKNNKLIQLYLYSMEDFSKLGGIPEDKFILFSSEYGIVLAKKEYETESRAFSFGAEYFYQFEEYYDKHAVYKEEITQ